MAAPIARRPRPVAAERGRNEAQYDARDSSADALARATLSAAWLAPEALEDVAAVVAERDYPPALAPVWGAMLRLHRRGAPADLTLLADELRSAGALEAVGGLPGVADVLDTEATGAHALSYARRLRRRALEERLSWLGERTAASPDDVGVRAETAAVLRELTALEAAPDAEPESVAVAPSVPSWPAPLADAAFIGPLGEYVRLIEPHTEADPAALLLQALAAFGSVAGRHRYYLAEEDRHFPNLFVAVVGETSKGRKGTSWGRTRGLLAAVDETWQTLSGLSSGEGLIWQVRDPIMGRQRTRAGTYEDVETDPGVADKRLLVVESEYARVLAVIQRQGNTLSDTVRDAWDRGALRAATKNSPARATDAHISIIGHITMSELRRELHETETANGFANRFLFVAARRSRELPFGGRADTLELSGILRRLAEAVERAREPGEVEMDAEARARWVSVYSRLSAARPGLIGAVTARAEAQVVRLALVYALSEGADAIELRHLDAALAVWAYCAASAAYIFGDALGDRLADAVLASIRAAGAEGISRTDLREEHDRGHGHRLARALETLAAAGLAHPRRVATRGRPAERWYPGPARPGPSGPVGGGEDAQRGSPPGSRSSESSQSSETGEPGGDFPSFASIASRPPFPDEPPPPDDADAPDWTAESPEDWAEVVP